jgi:hypothetical protein
VRVVFGWLIDAVLGAGGWHAAMPDAGRPPPHDADNRSHQL